VHLELLKTKDNCYKIISQHNGRHPALKHLATLLSESNKFADVKIGIYSIPPNSFQAFKSVYSYISNRVEKMGKVKFYKFIKGQKQLAPQKKVEWNSADDELKDLFEE